MSEIIVSRDGALDGWPNTLGVSEHNGSGARAVPVEALERATLHLLLRRKFVIPGHCLPITAKTGRLHWYAPIMPFTTQLVIQGMYSTQLTDNEWITSEIYLDEVLQDSLRLPPSVSAGVGSAVNFSIQIEVGTGVAGDKQERRIEMTWTASENATFYSTQLVQVPIDAITV